MSRDDISRETDYDLLVRQVKSLAEGDVSWLSLLSNVSALIAEALVDVSWVGFYLVDGVVDSHVVAGSDAPELVLGPFQGKVACTNIPWGRGVCGTAAQLDATQLVPDVNLFEGHIACDSGSRSEVVVPLHDRTGERVIGVLDLDSYESARFTEVDAQGLERVVSILERSLDLA